MHDNVNNIDVSNEKVWVKHSFLKDFLHAQHNDWQEKCYLFLPGIEQEKTRSVSDVVRSDVSYSWKSFSESSLFKKII